MPKRHSFTRLVAVILYCGLPGLAVPAGFARTNPVAAPVPSPVAFSAYNAHPKLVVLVVIDQFRGDYLDRYRADFKGRGFRLFLDHGAYFPDCYYDYANTKTAPGHATLGTGAYTDGHGIASNEWWDLDRNKERPVSSVEDERYRQVGGPSGSETSQPGGGTGSGAATAGRSSNPAAANPGVANPAAAETAATPNKAAKAGGTPGASPRNLLASTLGDELRLATQGQSKVYGISLKDRASILPSGSAANAAFWIDQTSGYFVTSTYYTAQLPAWATAFNTSGRIEQAFKAVKAEEARAADAAEESDEDVIPLRPTTGFYGIVGRSPAANSYELDFARALIQGEKLGQHPVTDLVTISLSANDILGHQAGPDSTYQRQMVDALDSDLDAFFSWLDKNVEGGLGNIWVALSADHGIAPIPAEAARLGVPAASINLDKLGAAVNDAINLRFSPGERVDYLLSHQELPYMALNRPAFERAGVNETEAEEAVQRVLPAAVDSLFAPVPGSSVPSSAGNTSAGSKATPSEVRLPPHPTLVRSYTRLQLAAGQLPPTEFGVLLAHSYSPNGGWYVMTVFAGYQMESLSGATQTNHFSPWSYDRHVPLAFYGAPFAAGVYRGRVAPVDLATTLASLLGVNQPSASIGHVLTQALRPAAAVSYPHPPIVRPRGRRNRKSGPDVPNAAPDAVPDASQGPVPNSVNGTPASVPGSPAAVPSASTSIPGAPAPASGRPSDAPNPQSQPPAVPAKPPGSKQPQ